MNRVPLTNGQVALVDEADYAFVAQWKWQAVWDRRLKAFYAVRTGRVGGQRTTIKMHRLLMGLEKGDKRVVDHVNHDTLDNRRCNLRTCTQAQNLWNMRTRSNNTSGHTGVKWYKRERKWQVSFQMNNQFQYVGYFDSFELAVAAYRARVAEVRGEFVYQEVA